MLQVFFPFFAAICLSAVAAYYSVIGLAEIFPGSFWPIVIMGSILEMSKLVTVSWLYNNWTITVRLMRYYFLVAIVLLMVITSMGIFGYLSKAHLETNVIVGANSVQIKTLEKQEKIVSERLEYLMKRAGDPSLASRKIDKQIQEVQLELSGLNERKLPLMTEENRLSAEIGPIKYIAEALYTRDDPHFIDKAVRGIIIIIIIVFDPLAILLLIASNQSYARLKIVEDEEEIVENKKMSRKTKVRSSTAPSIEMFAEGDNEVIPKSKIVKIGEM